MANRVLVSVEDDFPVPTWIERVEPFMHKVLSALEYDGQEFSIMFCSDELIKSLNKEYRNIDDATDVLSFENGDTYTDEDGNTWTEVGDIAISLETLPKNAQYFSVTADEELKRLLIHGLLHLNGYDHGDEHVEKGVEPVCEMLKLQKKLLESLEKETILG